MTAGAVIGVTRRERTSARSLLAALAVCAGLAPPGAAFAGPGAGGTGGGATTETGDAPLDHPLFDANHCLAGVTRQAGAVEFHWGCPEKHLITIACVFDGAGYPGSAGPGWHCNHPLPVLEDEHGRRISDVAVGDSGGRAVWAACATAGLGRFADPVKPYHGTPCHRAMLGIKEAVNSGVQDPRAAAAGLPPYSARALPWCRHPRSA